MQRKFETLLLFSPDLTAENRQQILDVLEGLVRDNSGQMVEVDDWGMRDLAYPVKKHTRGRYVRLEYGLNGTLVSELERRIRITDGILKFITVRLADTFQPTEEE
ncbi:MAG: 30S ribosomal protein S6 [Desulfohalobiaceae bacterium]|nr:30S ribosomal protein S6 [Desulfohalobiaceae bacterium]